MPVDMKQMIAETFAGLLEQKKLEKITVKELVEACHISRQAFYYHFQDTMEVVEYLMEQRMQKTMELSLAADSPQEALKAVITATAGEKRLVQHLLSSQRKDELILLLQRSARTYFDKLIREKSGGKSFSADSLETAVAFYTYGVAGLLLENLKKEQDPDILAGQICKLISGEVWNEREPSGR